MPLDLTQRDSGALREFVGRVREDLGENVLAVKLFGSKARGDADPESDLDVLVVVGARRVESEDRILDIAFDVNLAHDVYISPRVIEQAVFEHPVWRITPFVQALEREGVPL
jgi:predicted nucleotidyltransferase